MPPHPLPGDLSALGLAAWLRLATVTRVQRLDPSTVRPFAESGGRDGWLSVAQDLRALLADVASRVLEAASDEHCYAMWVGKSHIDAIVSRILGPEVSP